MKVAYFNCFAGASGDMIMGSLLDAGLDIEKLKSELEKLNLSNYKIQADKGMRKGISGTKFDVTIPHEHHHRGLGDILNIINQSDLSAEIKETSTKIFTRLAEAEAKIHNKTVDEIHFHEVGAVDAIVDIVGAVIGLNLLGIDQVITSPFYIGTGTLKCAHGILPVPAPATQELLKGVPTKSTGIESELVTPTGAAILTTLAESHSPMPSMTVEMTGYGLGGRDLDIPNVLRVSIGTTESVMDQDCVQLIETNIDDMNPQFYEHIMERLFAQGAKDVFLTPIIMKKSRPGVIVSVLAVPDDVDDCIQILFNETTTLGVRISEVKKRRVLDREIVTLDTPWGEARVKIRETSQGKKSVAPEYDDCKRIAQENGIPIQDVWHRIKRIAEEKTGD